MQDITVNGVDSRLCDGRKISGINRYAAMRCGEVRFVVLHCKAKHFAVN